ncbi:MAG: hypothetical protein CR217_12505 [Beijerinckiaceae bacterium]|nr:MAG: hypothetical protein CR217_12505 [Beijerinckiaceae bacterium]
MDQFPADGAEENNLFCNPAPNGPISHKPQTLRIANEKVGKASLIRSTSCDRFGAARHRLCFG